MSWAGNLTVGEFLFLCAILLFGALGIWMSSIWDAVTKKESKEGLLK